MFGLFKFLSMILHLVAATLTMFTGAVWPCMLSATTLDIHDESKDVVCLQVSTSILMSQSSVLAFSDDGKASSEHAEKNELSCAAKSRLRTVLCMRC